MSEHGKHEQKGEASRRVTLRLTESQYDRVALVADITGGTIQSTVADAVEMETRRLLEDPDFRRQAEARLERQWQAISLPGDDGADERGDDGPGRGP